MRFTRDQQTRLSEAFAKDLTKLAELSARVRQQLADLAERYGLSPAELTPFVFDAPPVSRGEKKECPRGRLRRKKAGKVRHRHFRTGPVPRRKSVTPGTALQCVLESIAHYEAIAPDSIIDAEVIRNAVERANPDIYAALGPRKLNKAINNARQRGFLDYGPITGAHRDAPQQYRLTAKGQKRLADLREVSADKGAPP